MGIPEWCLLYGFGLWLLSIDYVLLQWISVDIITDCSGVSLCWYLVLHLYSPFQICYSKSHLSKIMCGCFTALVLLNTIKLCSYLHIKSRSQKLTNLFLQSTPVSTPFGAWTLNLLVKFSTHLIFLRWSYFSNSGVCLSSWASVSHSASSVYSSNSSVSL